MSWGGGSFRPWRRVCGDVLERDGHPGRLGWPARVGEVTEVDQVINIAVTGVYRRDALDPDDWIAFCANCRWLKTKRIRPPPRGQPPVRRSRRRSPR